MWYLIKKKKKELFNVRHLNNMATGMPSVVEKFSSSENIAIYYKALD